MPIKKNFTQSLKDVKTLKKLSNEDLLSLYGLYKQATAGDVSGPKPGAFDLKGKAKYRAWSDRQGQSKEEAMTQYVALVERLKGTH